MIYLINKYFVPCQALISVQTWPMTGCQAAQFVLIIMRRTRMIVCLFTARLIYAPYGKKIKILLFSAVVSLQLNEYYDDSLILI